MVKGVLYPVPEVNADEYCFSVKDVNEEILAATLNERERIKELLSDAAMQQNAAGDVDGAQILAEAVKLIEPVVPGSRLLITDEEGEFPDPIGPEAEQQEKIEFDTELQGGDPLPPARERPDEEVMASMASSRLRRG